MTPPPEPAFSEWCAAHPEVAAQCAAVRAHIMADSISGYDWTVVVVVVFGLVLAAIALCMVYRAYRRMAQVDVAEDLMRKALVIKPGDVVLATCSEHMTTETMAHIREYLDDACRQLQIKILLFPPNIEVVRLYVNGEEVTVDRT